MKCYKSLKSQLANYVYIKISNGFSWFFRIIDILALKSFKTNTNKILKNICFSFLTHHLPFTSHSKTHIWKTQFHGKWEELMQN